MTAKITITNIGKRYQSRQGEIVALAQVNLAVKPGEFMCIVGPSGCGKSTLLRMLAGISTYDEGELAIAGLREAGVQPARPRTAMVFQEYALFPWRTVLDNVAFGLEMVRISKSFCKLFVLRFRESRR